MCNKKVLSSKTHWFEFSFAVLWIESFLIAIAALIYLCFQWYNGRKLRICFWKLETPSWKRAVMKPPSWSQPVVLNNGNTSTMCKVFSMLKTKRRQWRFLVSLWTDLTHYSGVSTIDFEELNAGWDACTEKLVSCFSLARKV